MARAVPSIRDSSTLSRGEQIMFAALLYPTAERAGRSKWLLSGGVNRPPQRPPSVNQCEARNAHVSTVVRVAGMSPTRRSAANEGQRVCSDAGASGLI